MYSRRTEPTTVNQLRIQNTLHRTEEITIRTSRTIAGILIVDRQSAGRVHAAYLQAGKIDGGIRT